MWSSQIEGTQATLEDVLDPLIEKKANQNVADENYIKATEFVLERMNSLQSELHDANIKKIDAGILIQTNNANHNY